MAKSSELAVYGESSYAISDPFEITVGIRLSQIKASDNGGSGIEVNETMVAPKVTLTFRPTDELMAYATVASGFRPPVRNSGVPAHAAQLQALGSPIAVQQAAFLSANLVTDGDEVLNYELGFKGTVWDGRMQFATAAYYMDWKKTLVSQQLATLLSPFFPITSNAGTAHTQGLEAEVSLALTERLSLRLAGSVIDDAKLDTIREQIGGFPSLQGGVIGPGARLALSPEYSFNIGLSYQLALMNAYPVTAGLNWYGVADQFAAADNVHVLPGNDHIISGRVTVMSPGDRWQVSLFGENLTNELQYLGVTAIGKNYGPSRTLGLSVEYRM